MSRNHVSRATPDRDWRPDDYLAFAGPRLRPALELMRHVDLLPGRPAPRRIVDLGCGAGEPTVALARRWPEARVEGVDSSRAMLDEAKSLDVDDGLRERLSWRLGDVASWQSKGESADEAPDLIYSNACLHWLPDHETLVPRLFRSLAPGGVLALQMPLSWTLPSHRLMREVLTDLAAELRRSDGLDALRGRLASPPVVEPAHYLRLLTPLAERTDVWTTTYWQVLEGEEPVYRWVSSAGLRPVREGLDAADWPVFEAEYRRRLRDAYPAETDGTTLFPFPRLFVVSVRKAELEPVP